MRKREEIFNDAQELAIRDQLKIEVLLDIREILYDIKELKRIQMKNLNL